ncbi:bifunctional phosphopantothenoylcysteine decarboxylase/phosphopantothenate--cysteine ligase CoaBC [Companilactobacillus pabuli]|jgi:phosphopantothenoylcysteine decarboxylase/phosphopantothenate--cysteine ligase|uniref:Coenzyme A biosynthesis bifunctional protein CoaBC n=1 Tax=Companilactobacillus pabuli TaxID=2714036 RepID=A0A7L7KV28_9LACO|nr:bifunctional phosphopantothenoylcysteine decarboxylase/phosphopantothenate--cysteine ligase CoaBC [Companilactobacillus pabuli]AKP02227.1 phosphopantothenoylcysteine decarboxylase [Companilactobacillus farciminis]AKS50524.1 phosphopantothenoylcysteine decarboxylase [Companilactobacillus farciminis]MDG5113616.1 bifunctional phosphopantothenoylcysteine decarboxylase/phosphopantothenate--cysteine ligase CoaBC [Companilactobacillus pabuli]QMT83660.1 bifunctional phosphopantothenoylcysteine decar
MLKDKNIAVYVSGGIAAYKTLNVVRALIKQQVNVQVIMTKEAQQFVTPLTFATLSQRPVITDNFTAQTSNDDFIPHIKLALWTDLAIVVPATANIIGKMANGIADDVVSTSLLATKAPKLVFPAMNTDMLDNPAVQRNLQFLQANNVKVIQPATGFLAEGMTGKGRLPELDEIMTSIEEFFIEPKLKGQKVIVTAGGTKEAIDPVRYIGNRSSGKMGIAMAKVARNLGADVTLITSVKTELSGVNKIEIQTADELMQALKQEFPQTDVLVMAAAVADFKPMTVADQKIKKNPNEDIFTIKLTKNPDILKTIAATKTKQFVVGFAAETQNLLDNAEKKLNSKNADVILANNVAQAGAGFGVDTNKITLLQKNHAPETWPLMSKIDVAKKFWDFYLQQ